MYEILNNLISSVEIKGSSKATYHSRINGFQVVGLDIAGPKLYTEKD